MSGPLRVVIPYVLGKLHATTRAWAGQNGAELRDVGADREAYFRLMRSLWSEGEAFMVVEHDVVPPEGAVAELSACREDWCGHAYAYVGGHVLEGHLGCTRFSRRLVRANPRLMDEAARGRLAIDFADGRTRDYGWLSVRVAAALIGAGARFHRHEPNAAHHHDAEDLRRVDAREWAEVRFAVRYWELVARLAEQLGDGARHRDAVARETEARAMLARATPYIATR